LKLINFIYGETLLLKYTSTRNGKQVTTTEYFKYIGPFDRKLRFVNNQKRITLVISQKAATKAVWDAVTDPNNKPKVEP